MTVAIHSICTGLYVGIHGIRWLYVTIMRTVSIFPYISSKKLKHTDAYGHAIVTHSAEILSEVVPNKPAWGITLSTRTVDQW